MARRMLQPIEDKRSEFYIEWLSNKYGNFIAHKYYKAIAQFTKPYNHMNTGFRITDEDGDFYTLDQRDIDKKFRICEPGEVILISEPITQKDLKNCCCNCAHDIRIPSETNPDMVDHNECDIDGHYIGYVACFEDCCDNWSPDRFTQNER